MTRRNGVFRIPQYVFQQKAEVNQANPVSGTQYSLLPTTRNVRVLGLEASCTWTVQPNPLEMHMTVDGKAVKFSQGNPVSTTLYRPLVELAKALNAMNCSGTAYHVYSLRQWDCAELKVDVEVTGGTVQSLDADLIYYIMQ